MPQIVTSRRQHINNAEKKRNSSLIALATKKERPIECAPGSGYLLFVDDLEVLRLVLCALAGLLLVRRLAAG